ncbi:MAG TPA: creatininase family protein [Candidatus Limnocylindrales bacterium]|nr:creatininase family protein [Candidatus Limnocylindrales bacterium]
MAPRKWAELTWEEIRRLEGSRPVALLPVGAIEAHGPHLPLGTDVLIADAMAEAAATKLEAAGLTPVLLPALPYAAAPFGASFPGTISVDPEAVKRLVLDLARALSRRGFLALGIANAHLDPAHLTALAAASETASSERLLPVVCPDLTRKPWALRLTEEFQSGACHAGRFEGSIVLAVRPDLVRDEIRSGLPPVEASLSRAIRSGARTFEEAGGPRAYFGRPAEATAEEGRRTIETLGEILAEAVREWLPAEGRRG